MHGQKSKGEKVDQLEDKRYKGTRPSWKKGEIKYKMGKTWGKESSEGKKQQAENRGSTRTCKGVWQYKRNKEGG